MTTSPRDLLSQEWNTLHQDHERYDRYALLIKLTAVLASTLSAPFCRVSEPVAFRIKA